MYYLDKVNRDSDLEINSKSDIGLEKVLVALSKRAMGDENLSEFKKLEKNIGKVEKESNEFWHDYHKYELFGPEKGKVFLKFAHDKVQELKSNLKGEPLKDFLWLIAVMIQEIIHYLDKHMKKKISILCINFLNNIL